MSTTVIGYHPATSTFSVEHRPGGPLRMRLNKASAVALATRLGATECQARLAAVKARCRSERTGLDGLASIHLCPICGHGPGHDHTDCEF